MICKTERRRVVKNALVEIKAMLFEQTSDPRNKIRCEMTIVEVRLAQANLYIKPINSYREINQPKYRKFATLRGKCTSF